MAEISIKPAAGVLIVTAETEPPIKLIKDSEGTALKVGSVIKAGPSVLTDYGTMIEPPAKEGDTILFLAYESAIDKFKMNGDRYYAVLFKDVRAVL